ncbi:CocE/NonD family hydrolase [Bowmanella denitrificans]|uniref:CocE/NonD family hydrolase n=1 Tax=Bowmanella denitrificans TaxID=366582 RepID=UPI000C9BA0EB|nr:CocE/NonD family hydrolase [Bowmanella denitrificans]
MQNKHLNWLLGLLCWVIFLPTAVADEQAKQQQQARADYIRAHYAKYEYQIPMRDGVKLFTSVYIPYDKSKTYPILMQRTPYRVAPYGASSYKTALGPSEIFEKEGFIFVFQDVRGKFMSEGEYVNMRPQNAYQKGGKAADDATDTYDSIDWLVKNLPNNNGKVGMWGTSYPGYYTSVAAINSHKALKAISPQAPIADWFYDDFHRNGAFVTPMAFLFFDSFDKQRHGLHYAWPDKMKEQTPDGYDFFLKLGPLTNVNKLYFKGERPFWNELTEHPNYDDYWQARNVLQHLDKVKPATLVVGGWYDTEDLYGPLATYQTMSKANKADNVRLIMGPWYHGQWNRGKGDVMGEAQFGFDTSDWFQHHVLLPFFKQHLKDEQSAALAQATMFETGANRWRQFAQWPPKEGKETTLYFAAHQQLRSQPDSQGGFDSYISDPAKPVPHSAKVSRGWDKPYMAEDQRFAARRTDVLVFETEPAQQDMTLAGPIDVNLWVSTDQGDADFVVKLVDVFPGKTFDDDKVDANTGNRHELVRWGVMRGRFRDSMSQPKPFEAGKPTLVSFQLYDVLHTIKRGHKLQIQVQSSMFPFLDRNPQKYVGNIFEAKESDFVKAEHRLYHSNDYPSSIQFKQLN